MSPVKPLSPVEYEAYVGQVLARLDFAKTGKLTRNNKYDGVRQPGKYEIDVALHVDLAEALKFFLIVECKNWAKPVGRDVVQKLAQTRDAISADKAAIASPVGFTKEAVEVARTLEIALWVVTLDEWVVIYDNGPHILELDLIKKESGRDWAADPPWTRLSEWSEYSLATIDKLNKLPPHLSWARFCNLGYNGDAEMEMRDLIANVLFDPNDGESRKPRRGGIAHKEGDATPIRGR